MKLSIELRRFSSAKVKKTSCHFAYISFVVAAAVLMFFQAATTNRFFRPMLFQDAIVLFDEYGVAPHRGQNQSVLFDVISVGSNLRLDYQDAQQATFGSHPSIRYFVRVTEDDDYDQACHNLTNEEVFQISKICRARKWERHQLLRFLRGHYGRIAFLQGKANPAGWVCAHRRPVHGFSKAVKMYRNQRKSLPDFLVIMDDDTYLNMDLVSAFLDSTNRFPQAIAGCMVRHAIHQINFTFPYGGWGLIYNKRALGNLIRPIHCRRQENGDTFLEESCKTLKDNQIGEYEVFQEGMSLSDLMEAYVSLQPYSNYRNWSTGYCLHADWF